MTPGPMQSCKWKNWNKNSEFKFLANFPEKEKVPGDIIEEIDFSVKCGICTEVKIDDNHQA